MFNGDIAKHKRKGQPQTPCKLVLRYAQLITLPISCATD